MPAATALVTGNDPTTQLAEQAVRAAVHKLGPDMPVGGVLLFLSPEFTRHAASAVVAAARAGRCLQVFGSIAAGVCTEEGWVLDRPAAAAMALGAPLSLTSPGAADDAPMLCCTSTPFPSEWADSRRFGLHFHGTTGQSAVWQAGRLAELGIAEAGLRGATPAFVVSAGLWPLASPRQASGVRGYDLLAVDRRPALDDLLATLPAEWRERLPLHLINIVLGSDGEAPRSAAIIAANADRSLTLTEALHPGDRVQWAIRDPLAAAAETRAQLSALDAPSADFALYFSCIGRGPYFHGKDDLDLAALTERFPGLPLIGAYGTGQIAFHGTRSRQLQNAVVAAIYEKSNQENPHVQP